MNEESAYITLNELTALDPPSAGTKAANNPLATAELIVAKIRDNPEATYIAFGLNRLQKVRYSKKTMRMRAVTVMLESEKTDELELLAAMVIALRGHHDFDRRPVELHLVKEKAAAMRAGEGGGMKEGDKK